ncbi:hypothetical protein ACIBFB_05615 [Nocardiopsis sp. NPDC050513]|uniref:hypothetical protein n=1 Tax=Nocardiopsis sp. NPDC050513 TaxID=3364338 RepID=UPI0037A6379E
MSGGGGPRDFWERERGSAPRPTVPAGAPVYGARAPRHPSGAPAPGPSAAPRPVGPPPRVGGAVAALVVALLTLAVPVTGIALGQFYFVLLANIPGIGLGVAALVKIPDTAEVERFLRYTWACNFAYIAVSAVLLAAFALLMVIVLGLPA